jgi:hypothetical protein
LALKLGQNPADGEAIVRYSRRRQDPRLAKKVSLEILESGRLAKIEFFETFDLLGNCGRLSNARFFRECCVPPFESTFTRTTGQVESGMLNAKIVSAEAILVLAEPPHGLEGGDRR